MLHHARGSPEGSGRSTDEEPVTNSYAMYLQIKMRVHINPARDHIGAGRIDNARVRFAKPWPYVRDHAAIDQQISAHRIGRSHDDSVLYEGPLHHRSINGSLRFHQSAARCCILLQSFLPISRAKASTSPSSTVNTSPSSTI